MTDEKDLILEEGEGLSYIEIIENQLTIITTMVELESEAYDALAEDKIKAISCAMRIIHKCQRMLLSAV